MWKWIGISAVLAALLGTVAMARGWLKASQEPTARVQAG